MKAMATGRDTTREAAISSGQAVAASPMNVFTSPGGRVCLSGPARVRAKMKSFQPRTNANSPAATSPGAARGITTEWMIRRREAPSIRAASMSSSGMVSKKPLSIHTHSGSVKVVNDSTSAVYVFSRPYAENTAYRVISSRA
ncbi:hypothetical protein JCM13591A_34260 [Microbacterium xylanilyticum]